MDETTICLKDGCDRQAICRGLCGNHYRSAWRAGRYKVRRLPIICEIRGCDWLACRQGMCHKHWAWIRQAHRLATDPVYRANRNRQAGECIKRHPEYKERRAKGTTRWQRETNWHDYLFKSCRTDAKRRQYPCDIDADYLLSLWRQQGGRCYWLGIELVPSVTVRDPRRPSVDKLDPSKGYTRGNVVIASMFANLGRSNFPADEFRKFADELMGTASAAK
jgi:hypothetical protein